MAMVRQLLSGAILLFCASSALAHPSPAGPGTNCFQDLDQDGFGSNVMISSVDLDCTDPGESSNNADCNDANQLINPGAIEIVGDSIDQNCNGSENCYQDLDDDNYGSSILISGDMDCFDAFEASVQGDCSDTNFNINPGALEIVGDNIDQNCNGSELCYQDLDNDDYGSMIVSASPDADCNDVFEATNTMDCNDSSSAIHPAALEITGDGIDQNCDGGEICYSDPDNDNFGSLSVVSSIDLDCADANEASVQGDCNNNDPTIYPGALEIPGDFIDQDCSGGDMCYQDLDNDDFGTFVLVSSTDFDCIDANEAPVPGDCDDSDASINPGAIDLPGDGIDQDCSGSNATISFVRGDANADGGSDIGDPITMLGFMFSGVSVPCLRALDGNDDEAVDIGDPVYILGGLFSGGPLPNAPFPVCGGDPTPGPLGCVSFPPCP
jgi:Putative metal-binding motif